MTDGYVDHWTLRVSGAPRTKKNSRMAGKGGRGAPTLPSAAWQKWRNNAAVNLIVRPSEEWWPTWYGMVSWYHRARVKVNRVWQGDALIDDMKRAVWDRRDGRFIRWEHRPARLRLNCAATFYRDRDQGDAVGFYQGVADLLETFGVLSDDRMIVSWNGSELLIDRNLPRVELCLTVK